MYDFSEILPEKAVFLIISAIGQIYSCLSSVQCLLFVCLYFSLFGFCLYLFLKNKDVQFY